MPRRSDGPSAACSSTARTRTWSAPPIWRRWHERRRHRPAGDGAGRPARPGPGGAIVRLETVELDLAPLVAAFGRRLHEAGVPVTAERSARLASALSLTRPVARTRLYWTARAVLVSDQAQVAAFDRVFFAVFGSRADEPEFPGA